MLICSMGLECSSECRSLLPLCGTLGGFQVSLEPKEAEGLFSTVTYLGGLEIQCLQISLLCPQAFCKWWSWPGCWGLAGKN